MHYKHLTSDIWTPLPSHGAPGGGYKSRIVTGDSKSSVKILVFKDEKNRSHLVIHLAAKYKKEVPEITFNGLGIGIQKYNFVSQGIGDYIDLECRDKRCQKEFGEISREICWKIIEKQVSPVEAVRDVANSWRWFWGTQSKGLLSEESQVGLFCELSVLKKLCEVSAEEGLLAWRGPLKETQDFITNKWAIEVKGTLRNAHAHLINGLTQLTPPGGKRLAFASFLVNKSTQPSVKSLPEQIVEIEDLLTKASPDLVSKFNRLLLAYGYNKADSEEYRKCRMLHYATSLIVVGADFPRLTAAMLKKPLSPRISTVQYRIDLTGIDGEKFEQADFSKYL